MGKLKNFLLTEAPTYPPYGLSVDEFAEAQESFTEYARSRVYVGSQDYDLGESQRMENLSVNNVITELREEIADAVNYLVGLDIVVSRLFPTVDDWLKFGIEQGWAIPKTETEV